MRLPQMSEVRLREILREELERVAVPRLLDAREVAERLSVSRAHVYTLMDKQTLRSVYVGRRRLVRAESLVAYVDSLPDHFG